MLSILANLLLWSILGCLGRIALIELTNYPHSYINTGINIGTCLWVNFAACLIINTINHNRIRTKNDNNKGPLYIGLTVGFCGTLSTFSSLIMEASLKAFNISDGTHDVRYKNSAYGIMEWLSVILVQFGVSSLGFLIGQTINVQDYLGYVTKYRTLESDRYFRYAVFIGSILLLLLIVFLAIFLPDSNFFRHWATSICFAPVGCFLRYFLSQQLNGTLKRLGIFLGTLVCNLVAVLVECICFLLLRISRINKKADILVLNSIIVGFCGTLSTTSTLMVELASLTPLHRYKYFTASVFLSFLFPVLIIGVYNWTRGLSPV
ncbi:BA75_00013T0 [Komagataella pastoris]|uniref:BA75_00013T0 n=1 Tax=Komagataella pastoris TaxID=4922 RepID=A0A1B2J5J8_PICPA|nr:BA75_00013T0 [Komagataella pastoris]